MNAAGLLRVYANDTRGSAGDKGRCKYCGAPITWFITVKNQKKVPIDGHDPAPLRTERDPVTFERVEFHARDTVHFATCTARPQQNQSRAGAR